MSIGMISRMTHRIRTMRFDRGNRQAARIALLSTVLLTNACADSPLVTPPSTSTSRDLLKTMVSPAVAARLDRDGQFQLPTPAPTDGYPEITSAQVTELATAWIKEFAPQIRPRLEQRHGSTINFHTLSICGRILYARSAYSTVPDVVPLPYRRPFGPWYFVTICDQGAVPTISLAVSAWATDLQVENGRIRFPSFGGGEFFAIGIPAGHHGEFPATPESVAALAARSGRIITSIPELVMQPTTAGPPQAARWHVSLDAPVSVRGVNSGLAQVKDLYIGLFHSDQNDLSEATPLPNQPAGADVRWLPPPSANETWAVYQQHMMDRTTTTHIARRSDSPLAFDAITQIGGESNAK